MTADDVLALAQRLIRIPESFDWADPRLLGRLAARDTLFGDVKRAVRTATSAKRHPAGRWRLHGGKDSDGRGLVPVISVLSSDRLRIDDILD